MEEDVSGGGHIQTGGEGEGKNILKRDSVFRLISWKREVVSEYDKNS